MLPQLFLLRTGAGMGRERRYLLLSLLSLLSLLLLLWALQLAKVGSINSTTQKKKIM